MDFGRRRHPRLTAAAHATTSMSPLERRARSAISPASSRNFNSAAAPIAQWATAENDF
jgi:hypothetical protein